MLMAKMKRTLSAIQYQTISTSRGNHSIRFICGQREFLIKNRSFFKSAYNKQGHFITFLNKMYLHNDEIWYQKWKEYERKNNIDSKNSSFYIKIAMHKLKSEKLAKNYRNRAN